MSDSDLTISPDRYVRESCFYNSFSSVYSKKEVITLVVLGVLALIMGSGALYGYLGDPTWLLGAHILTTTTVLSWAIAGVLVLVKYRQNDCPKNQGQQAEEDFGLSDDDILLCRQDHTPPGVAIVGYPPKDALEKVFGKKMGKMEEEKVDLSVSNIHSIHTLLEQMRYSVGFGKFKGGETFAMIKYKTGSGVTGGIVIYETSPKNHWRIHLYSSDNGKSVPRLKKFFGCPEDVAFLGELVSSGKAGEFELRAVL